MVEVGEGRLTYDLSEGAENKTNYFNLVKDLSWLNSKNYEHTTRDGHVLGYIVDLVFVDISSEENQIYLLLGSPNSWKMRNSFRKWHFAREHMFKEAGVTKEEQGKYGRTIRPFLDPNMVEYFEAVPGVPLVPKESNVMIPVGCDDGAREWTYTQVAATPGFDGVTATPALPLADKFALTICGLNAVEDSSGGIQTYKGAGMIHSYNLDRMEVITPDADETVTGPNNPLAAMFFQGTAVGEVMDIAEDQELENPPYDISDDGDSTNPIVYEYAVTNSDAFRMARIRNVFIPAGLLGIGIGEDLESIVTIDVKAIVECREWV